MAHLAIQEADENGEVVTWGDHVTETEYLGQTANEEGEQA